VCGIELIPENNIFTDRMAFLMLSGECSGAPSSPAVVGNKWPW